MMSAIVFRTSSLRPLHAAGLPTRTTPYTAVVIARSVNAGQIRGFRFRWSAHLDPELWRQHRDLWRKYMVCRSHADESFKLRQENYRGFIRDLDRLGYKEAAREVERDMEREKAELDEAQPWMRNPFGCSSGYAAYGFKARHINGEGTGSRTSSSAASNSRGNTKPTPKTPTETYPSSASLETESYIDPITNRRIAKNMSEQAQQEEPRPDRERENGDRGKIGSNEQDAAKGKVMTGNYVKDFPEEFSGSWAKHYKMEDGPEIASMDESFPPLEPALNRSATRAKDQERPKYTKAAEAANERPGKEEPAKKELVKEEPAEEPPRAIEVPKEEPVSVTEAAKEEPAKDEGLEKQIKTIYEESYGRIEQKPVLSSSLKSSPQPNLEKPPAEPAAPPPPPPPPRPSLYKILAVDPTTQMINTAEATSIAKDSAAPLAIGEVMQRLSNPSKFFPHFGPLQAQGYEIVSGSGDVLVFRKVREASEPGTVFLRGATKPSDTAARLKASSGAQTRPINPIDMMGSQPVTPSIGNFASPTGYVSYDGPRDEVKTKPPPPFRSMIDVRREEEVFSGPKVKREKRAKRYFTRVIAFASIFTLGAWWASYKRTDSRFLDERRVPSVSQVPPSRADGYERAGRGYSYGPPPEEKRSSRWW